MAGKAYKGRTCVYCSTPAASNTGDHVIARKFFLIPHRDGIPIVPACGRCNGEKSRLEHYLTAVLPFGGRHQDANANLQMVGPRLAGNRRLAAELAQGSQFRLVSKNGGPWEPERTIPFNGEQAVELFRMITKGLASFHWGLDLPDEACLTCAAFIADEHARPFEQLLAQNARSRVRHDLGEGTFVYEGAQAVDDPRITIWRLSLYGAQVGGDPGQPGQRAGVVYAFTAPRHMRAAGNLARLLGMPEAGLGPAPNAAA
jgi:hypothetical protein